MCRFHLINSSLANLAFKVSKKEPSQFGYNMLIIVEKAGLVLQFLRQLFGLFRFNYKRLILHVRDYNELPA